MRGIFRAGESVTVATFAAAVGRVIVVVSERGLRAVFFAEVGAANAPLGARLAAARVLSHDSASRAAAAQVEAHLDNPRLPLDLTLDPLGTSFQKQVWAALMRVPVGATTTYGALARAIDRPLAARAVGGACGANPLAVVVPCHRVIGRSGEPVGYRWGVARKQALLARELPWGPPLRPPAVASGC